MTTSNVGCTSSKKRQLPESATYKVGTTLVCLTLPRKLSKPVDRSVHQFTNLRFFLGYIMFQYAVSMNLVKGILPGAHLEAARGTRAQNYTYCTKNDTEHQRWPDTEVVHYFNTPELFFFFHLMFKINNEDYHY